MFKKYFLGGLVGGIPVIAIMAFVGISQMGQFEKKNEVTEVKAAGINSNDDRILKEIQALTAKISAVSGSVEVLEHRLKDQSALTEKYYNESTLIADSSNSQKNQSELNGNESDFEDEEVTLETASQQSELPPLTDEEQIAQQQAEWQQQIDTLATTLSLQTTDEIWQQELTENFEQTFSKHASNIVLDGLNCGDTMCRMQSHVTRDKNGIPRQGVRLDGIIHGELGWKGQMVSQFDMETGEYVAWLLKEGTSLSDLMK